MRTKVVILTALAVAFLAGWLMAGDAVPCRDRPQPNAGFAAVPGEKGGLDITGPYEVVPNWPKPMSPACPATRTGRGARCRASSPRARTASTWCSAASCRGCSGPPRGPSPRSARASRSRSGRCRGATRRRARRRARPAPAGQAPTLTIRSRTGRDAWASTPAGSTPSSSSTPPATSSSRGRSGTR